jgi:hypothetical protein
VDSPRLTQDWIQVFDNPDNEAFEKLRTDLEQLGKTIEERNKHREPNLDFHPFQAAALSISSLSAETSCEDYNAWEK